MQPIDMSYFLSSYFILTTFISLAVAGIGVYFLDN